MDEIRDGGWFPKLLTFSLARYVDEVDAAYFRAKYPNLPPDAVVEARIQMAARYASIEGGLSSAAYTGAVAATIGSGGGASPLTIPGGVASFVVDLTYTSQLQMRLAYDIAVLYGVPISTDDPDDLWKLIRIAFGIKAGEVGSGAALKAVPAMVRPLVRKVFSGSTLAATKSLPVVGKHLLQRNLIKFAIPVIGVPVSSVGNYWLTKVAGGQARAIFRNEARVIESAGRLAASVSDQATLLWVLYLVIQSDGRVSDRERLLLHHVARIVGDVDPDLSALAEMREVIEVDPGRVHARVDGAADDARGLYDAAVLAACVDGRVPKEERAVLSTVASWCGTTYDARAVTALAKRWD